MRRFITVLLTLSVLLAACDTIKENVKIDVDVEGIIASTCTQLADKFAERLAEALIELDTNTDANLPDIDVGSMIDRAEGLGCSPDEMRRLVADNLEKVDATGERAKELIDQVSSDLESATG